jgi:hypothetical protein
VPYPYRHFGVDVVVEDGLTRRPVLALDARHARLQDLLLYPDARLAPRQLPLARARGRLRLRRRGVAVRVAYLKANFESGLSLDGL